MWLGRVAVVVVLLSAASSCARAQAGIMDIEIFDQTESPLIASAGDDVAIYFEFSSSPDDTVVECTGPSSQTTLDEMNELGIVFNRADNNDTQLVRVEINITSVNYTLGGVYSCTANNSVDSITSEPASLLLLIRPVVEPTQALVENGDNITLMCLAQSIPEPSYRWRVFKDSNDSDTIPDFSRFASGSGEDMLATSPTLVFEPVVYGDAGEYRCIIDINGTQLESDDVLFAVSPEGSVRIEAVNMTLLFEANAPATLNCLASGGPNNTFSWFVDGQLIQNETATSLILYQVDGGEYTCTVSNAAGSDNASITLTEAPHSVMVMASDNIPSLNDTVYLMCESEGGPNVTYQWTKDGAILGSEMTLSIPGIDASSGGSYTCTVSNSAGNDSASITLYVQPYIVTPLEEQTLTSNGSEVNISCNAAGFPTPTVNWRDTEDIAVSNDSQLLFSPAMFGDEGLYRCVATAEINSMNFNATDETTLFVSPEGSVMVTVSDMISTRGSNVTFSCSAMGGPQNSFTWMKDGVMVGNDTTLTVTDIDASYGGSYTCTVSNSAGNDSASITLYVQPYIVTPLEEQTLTSNGSEVNISCNAAGFPTPTVNWRDMEDMVVSNDSQLLFSPAMFGDEGLYRCVATAEINSMNFNATDETTLFVSPEGSVMVTVSDMISTRGSNVTFSCSAMGGPQNSFTWMKDGMMVGNDTTLTVTDIGASSGGSYTCTVSNSAGNDSASITLYVQPYIVTPLEEQTLTSNGSEVNISCNAAGFPTPTVNWRDMEDMVVSNDSQLLFSPAMFGDEGLYRCVATAEINSMNFNATDETTLFVSPEGSVMVTVSDMISTRGSNVTFSCSAMGGPQNSFTWMKDGMMVGNDATLTMTDIDASSGGSYTCTVSNSAGNDSASITLYVQPYIITPLEEQTLTSNGSEVNVSCNAAGFPTPTVNWRDMEDMVVSNDSQLLFSPAMFGDEGLYRCVATAEINSMNFNATDETTLFVSPEGSVMVTVSDMISTRGSNVTFSCSAMGGPQNSFTWMKDGMMVGNDTTLTVTDIDASFGGSYTCTVSNSAGNDSASITLYVQPYIVTPLEEQTLTSNGSEVNVSCNAAGFPTPTVNWRDMEDMVVSNDSQLLFSPAMFGDEGLYRCVATAEINSMNFNATDETTLFVSPEGSVMVTVSDMISTRGSNVTFSCSAMGGPQNSFTWMKDGMMVGNDTTTLTVTDIDASSGGSYTCTVSNSAGNDSASITLYVQPYIITPLENVTLTSNGSFLNLTCVADGFPGPTVVWIRNSTDEIVVNGSTLIIPSVMFGEEGVYRCSATATVNQMDFEASDLTTVVVSPEGSVMVTPLDMVFSFGNNASFNCTALGGPDNTFVWERNGEVIANDNLLPVMNIDASSGGTYTCTVSNLAGNDSASTTLYVAPYFTVQPGSVRTLNSSNVNITCEAESFPSPDYVWVKDNNMDTVRGGVVSTEMPNSLIFSPVIFGDEGEHVCMASITVDMVTHTESSDTAVLTISPEGSVLADPTVINANSSGDATFNCSAMGGPGNTFSWTEIRDNRVVVNGSELTLENIMASDGGQYQCMVENTAGSDTVNVTLNVSPVITLHPQDQNVTSFEGTIMLVCEATGFPAPAITWFQNDTEQDNTTFTNEQVNVYTTRSVFMMPMPDRNDSGQYHCQATVDGYEAVNSNTSLVLVQDIPERPQNITALEIQSRYLVLTWIEPHDNNAPVLGYLVQYNQPEFDGGLLVVLNVSEERVNVTELFPGVTYNFTVTAYNDIGNSSESENTPVRTLDEAPNNSPQNVNATSLTSTTIDVSWEEVPPANRNGIITRYEVMYEPLETFGERLISETRNTSNLSIVLDGLHPFVEYNVSVTAYTSAGSGPPSDDIAETTLQDRPGMPLNVSAGIVANTTTEIRVNWEEVPDFNRNGTILLYEVVYRSTLDGADRTETSNTTNNSTFSLLLDGLQEFVEYNITVRAYTVAGPGDESTPVVTVMTPQDIPDAPNPPMEVAMEEINPMSATVRWAPVSEALANGPVISYTVNYVIAGPLMGSSMRRKRQIVEGMLVEDCIIGGTDNRDRNVTVGGNETSVTLQTLTPNVQYEVRIQAVGTLGGGDFSNATVFRTNEFVPREPRNLTVVYNSSTSLLLTWRRPLCEFGVLRNYTITYSPIEEDGNELGSPPSGMSVENDTTSLLITNLTINTGYTLSVAGSTNAGVGVAANQTGMTDEDAPNAVTELDVTSSRIPVNVTVNVSWTAPSTRNGSFNYRVRYSGAQLDDYPMEQRMRHQEQVVTVGGDMERLLFTGFPYANYSVSVTAINNKTGREGPTSVETYRTIPIESSPVTALNAVASSSESILVTWGLPVYPNGPLTQYRIYYGRANETTDPPPSNRNGYSLMTVPSTQTQYNISNLSPFTHYNIFIEAIGNVVGNASSVVPQRTNSTTTVINTDETSTSTPPTSATTFVYDLPPATFTTGPLKLYAVIVVRVTSTFVDNQMDYDDVGPYDKTMPNAPYIAAAWDNAQAVPDTITIGAGTMTTAGGMTFNNVGLASNTEYAALVRVEIVSDDPTMRLISYTQFQRVKTDLPYDPAGLGVGIVFIIIVLVCVAVAAVVGLYFYRTKYYLPKRKGYAVNNLELDESNNVQPLNIIQNPALVAKPYGHLYDPIPVDQFKEHVKSLHRNDDYPFSEEYSNVEPSHAPTSEATHYPYNASKNRYANISSYDHSRVKLNEVPGRPGSDYINANYIDGYRLDKGFIATQGPVPDSVPDFWRMIWEQNSATIVMVTNLEEKGRVKCHQYWPDDKTYIYGSMRVHIQEMLTLAEYTVRTFSLTKDDAKDERIVTQYHYTIWPDHGVPEYPTSLLHFVRKVMVSNPPKSGPIVVHCSAGVGRTGTFITLFNQLKRIDREGSVNVFNFVRSMRRNRCCMVQTESQYIFIHDALLEAIECGVTEVAARDLREQYKRLGAVDEVVGLTGLEIEFDKLNSTIHRRPTNTFGCLPINKPKNRYANVDMLPFDTSRCRLSFIPGVEGSDYINANFIDGYHKRKAFIATQGPLPDTSDDFWRLVWEQKCATIVMLTKEREGGRVKCHRYWPATGALNFRQYQVILHAVNEYPDYILREFKIVDTKDGSSLPVKQFQYTGWPEEGVPDAGTGLIDLVGQVQKWQRNSGTHPIVVHCSGGSGRTGTFIAISVLLERLKTEGVVDVFHTSRTLRLQRPGLIHTVDQYEFCYKTVLEYLESFELYANFK